jgi:hypothetical protein
MNESFLKCNWHPNPVRRPSNTRKPNPSSPRSRASSKKSIAVKGANSQRDFEVEERGDELFKEIQETNSVAELTYKFDCYWLRPVKRRQQFDNDLRIKDLRPPRDCRILIESQKRMVVPQTSVLTLLTK